MSSRIVIGDVHGCAKTLAALLAKLPPSIPITFLGDLPDRGPDSYSVVAQVLFGGHDCVKGNHEDMMAKYFLDPRPASEKDYDSDFGLNGGLKTLQSYMHDMDKFAEHAIWMSKLPLYLEYPECKRDDGRYLVVSHSGLGHVWRARNNPEKAHYFEEAVLWDRNRFLDQSEIYNVFGHTPQADGAKIKSFYANIDTGCCFARDYSETYGTLTALQFPEMIVYTQRNIEHE